jgi:hypothetical protein
MFHCPFGSGMAVTSSMSSFKHSPPETDRWLSNVTTKKASADSDTEGVLNSWLREGWVVGASQRVSRGFHRFALFLAAMILLVGGYYWVVSAIEYTDWGVRHYEALVCAHDFLQRDEKRFWELINRKPELGEDQLIDLKALQWQRYVRR